jgi:PD-(D/E)XK nuclease superfamily protein
MNTFSLAASDLTFLFDECLTCFYNKVRLRRRRPSAPFPSVFSRMDTQQKAYFVGRSTAEVDPTLPAGILIDGSRVQSRELSLPGHENTLRLSGITDTLIAFNDGTHGIIDFKTIVPKPGHVAFYGRQLMAYVLATEQPALGKLHLPSVTRLGLVCLEPVEMICLGERSYAHRTVPHWVEIPRDDNTFYGFLDTVLTLLEGPPPLPDADCGWCKWAA